MNKNYQIEGNRAQIITNKDVYALPVIKKAAAKFLEKTYVIIEENNLNYLISFELINLDVDLNIIVKEFYNELLRESIRYDVANETKHIRELLLARALYTTCLDNDEEIVTEDNSNEMFDRDFDLDKIAINWFDKNKD